MVLGVVRLQVEVPESRSLKDKRAVVRSLRDRIGARFTAAVAEVGDLDNPRQGELGIVCVSNDSRHADAMLGKILDFAENNCGDGLITSVNTEIIHLD